MKNRLLQILFWSVISAAFIGPGTITTAASAGAEFGFALLWALVFSTITCIILQEASSRITTVSGVNLGQALREYLFDQFWGRVTVFVILTAIILGCMAYEAGNILGAVEGAALILEVPTQLLTIVIGVFAFTLFAVGSIKVIARVMGIVVAVMGLCFVTTSLIIQSSIGDLLSNGLIPRFPQGSGMLILALIGTTVVPYNLFLGSGIASVQSLREMRWSLGIAIGLGGIISMAVLVVGASIAGEFTFPSLAAELAQTLGDWAAIFLGVGLFAAGFTSAVTAPLAAAITARSLLERKNERTPRWEYKGWGFRIVWGTVLLVGLFFGLIKVQPIPAIILAQALNGIILPLIAIFLLLMANNVRLLSSSAINPRIYNLLMGLVVFVTVIIGMTNLFKALTRAFSVELVNDQVIGGSALVLTILLAWPAYRAIRKLRYAEDLDFLSED